MCQKNKTKVQSVKTAFNKQTSLFITNIIEIEVIKQFIKSYI